MVDSAISYFQDRPSFPDFLSPGCSSAVQMFGCSRRMGSRMRFLLDENFPRAAVETLCAAGHEVHDFRDEGSIGASDQEVMHMAGELDAILLTTDKDFFHTVPFLFPDHPGTIVIALSQPDRESILNRLQWALSRVSADLRSKCYLVTDRKLYLRSK